MNHSLPEAHYYKAAKVFYLCEYFTFWLWGKIKKEKNVIVLDCCIQVKCYYLLPGIRIYGGSPKVNCPLLENPTHHILLSELLTWPWKVSELMHYSLKVEYLTFFKHTLLTLTVNGRNVSNQVCLMSIKALNFFLFFLTLNCLATTLSQLKITI